MGVFIIQELTNNNPTTLGTAFEWYDSRSLFSDEGAAANRENFENDVTDVPRKAYTGFYAAPQGNWSTALTLRTKRTDYPGVSRPSEQVLGAAYEPFTLTGMWDDRYNSAGYAMTTWGQMEEVVKRGNLCRFQYLDVVYHGIITSINTEYVGNWRINYTLTVSPHYKDVDPGSIQIQTNDQVMTTASVYDAVDFATATLQSMNNQRPEARIPGATLLAVDSAISRVDQARATIAFSLDTTELNPIANPIAQWNKFASQFVESQVAAELVITNTSPLRADIDIISPSAVVMLSFESWMRSVRAAARLVRYHARVSVKEMRKRFKPRAARLYRPFEGESIFAISNKFYGTPTAWRLIAERNRLSYYDLTGDEILVIPERSNV